MKKTWVMLTSNNVEQTKSSNKGLSKEFIKDLYQRDCIAKEIFKKNQNKPVTLENSKKVFSLEGPKFLKWAPPATSSVSVPALKLITTRKLFIPIK